MTRSAPAVVSVLSRRTAQAAGVAVVVTLACFATVQVLPGDIAYRIAAGRYGYDQVDAESAEAVRRSLGLDQPAIAQLGQWFLDLLQLDLGQSLITGAGVIDEVGHGLLGSVQLAATALILAVALGGVLGTAAARRPGGTLDRLTNAWVALSRSVPPFLLGLGMILVFSVHLGWLPAAGHGEHTSVLLPAATLAAGLSGPFARVTRDAVVQVRTSPHVRFARSRGLSDRAVTLRHVLRNAGTPIVAYVGVQALVLIEGVIVVESLFSWPGLGHLLVHAVFWRDIPVLQGTALALALLVVLLSALVDLATLALDPRPRKATA